MNYLSYLGNYTRRVNILLLGDNSIHYYVGRTKRGIGARLKELLRIINILVEEKYPVVEYLPSLNRGIKQLNHLKCE